MLKKLNPGTATLPGVYTIKLGFRFITYVENGGNVAKIDVEHVSGPDSMIVYASVLKHWDSPVDGIITPEKKAEIINRTDEALNVLNVTHIMG
jgi:hypothetical protein